MTMLSRPEKIRLRKQDTLTPSYAVLVEGEQIGVVFKTQNGMYSDFIWLPYLEGSEFPSADPTFTRRDAIAELVHQYNWERDHPAL